MILLYLFGFRGVIHLGGLKTVGHTKVYQQFASYYQKIKIGAKIHAREKAVFEDHLKGQTRK